MLIAEIIKENPTPQQEKDILQMARQIARNFRSFYEDEFAGTSLDDAYEIYYDELSVERKRIASEFELGLKTIPINDYWIIDAFFNRTGKLNFPFFDSVKSGDRNEFWKRFISLKI